MIDFIMFCMETLRETCGDLGDQVSRVSCGLRDGLLDFFNDFKQSLQVSWFGCVGSAKRARRSAKRGLY